MLVGYHVSAVGRLRQAIEEGAKLGCDVIQVFVGSPQVWQTPGCSEAAVERFREARRKSRIKYVLVHSAYLPNPSSHRASLRHMSLKKMKEEVKIAYAIGADGYNFHCGSNQVSTKEGIKLAIQILNRLAELTEAKWPAKLIIENDAGAGNRIGDTIEELGAIWKGLKDKKRFGFCLDTCHLFDSGIDLRTKRDIAALLTKFNRLIGLPHLKFIHLNDSKYPLGSKKDRHAHIGKGYIGLEGFRNILTHPKLKRLPFIMETPYTGEMRKDIPSRRKEMQLVRKLAR